MTSNSFQQITESHIKKENKKSKFILVIKIQLQIQGLVTKSKSSALTLRGHTTLTGGVEDTLLSEVSSHWSPPPCWVMASTSFCCCLMSNFTSGFFVGPQASLLDCGSFSAFEGVSLSLYKIHFFLKVSFCT